MEPWLALRPPMASGVWRSTLRDCRRPVASGTRARSRIGLRSVLGKSRSGVGDEEIARVLRAAIPLAELHATKLCTDIRSWEARNVAPNRAVSIEALRCWVDLPRRSTGGAGGDSGRPGVEASQVAKKIVSMRLSESTESGELRVDDPMNRSRGTSLPPRGATRRIRLPDDEAYSKQSFRKKVRKGSDSGALVLYRCLRDPNTPKWAAHHWGARLLHLPVGCHSRCHSGGRVLRRPS